MKTHNSYELLRLVVKFAGVATIVFLAVPLPVMLGEGKQTVITLTYQAILDGKLADKLQKGLVATLLVLTYLQRWHYMRRLKKLGGRQRNLELELDPNRSSSTPKASAAGEVQKGVAS